MVQMTCSEHDEYAASSQFLTHTMGRLLNGLNVRSTPINTKGFEALLAVEQNTCKGKGQIPFLGGFGSLFSLFALLSLAPHVVSPFRSSCAALCVLLRPCKDSMDLYAGLYEFNPEAPAQLDRIEEAIRVLRTQLQERVTLRREAP